MVSEQPVDCRIDTRKYIAEVWSSILNIPVTHDEDNFFELGGDSLSATTVVVKIQEDLGLVLDPIELFDTPELGSFAEAIRQALTTKQQNSGIADFEHQ